MTKKEFKLPGMQVPSADLVINLPIGPLFDLIYCEFSKGKYGETIVNGGLPQYVVIIGSVNNYKTTIMHYLTIAPFSKIIEAGYPSRIDTLDTEMSMKMSRLYQLAEKINPHLADVIKYSWNLTNTNAIAINDWVAKFEDMVESKDKDKSIDIVFEAFTNPQTDKPVINKIPTFLQLDTFSKFTNDKAYDKLKDNNLDDSGTNTVFLNIGMFKKKFLLPLPRNLARSNTYAVITAHVGEKISMESGPAMYIKPSKQLQYLKGGDEIEGGTKELKQAPNLMFQAHTAKPLVNKGTRQPEYPLYENDNDTDLNVVILTVLRNKSGHSGISIPAVVSQSEGVLPTLSAFHYLKEVGKWGMGGNNLSYFMVLRPDVKLSRTTVRTKIDNDPILRRAIELTADIFQLIMTRIEYKDIKYLIPIEKIYTKIKEMGYDWDKLLDTRGYPLIDNYNPEYKNYLSAPDVLDMYLETYHPYWYPIEGIKNEAIALIDSKKIK
jgi:hypothetical protein